jgi:hypothetical protein
MLQGYPKAVLLLPWSEPLAECVRDVVLGIARLSCVLASGFLAYLQESWNRSDIAIEPSFSHCELDKKWFRLHVPPNLESNLKRKFWKQSELGRFVA